ncbi:uncharacterized protein LOC141590185 [Silene latifolia]|uniref:uncharacterized protein LOC141590185 n=1 Tax=Silene latifolia TaxID=37657 RepID=UPI003D775CAA
MKVKQVFLQLGGQQHHEYKKQKHESAVYQWQYIAIAWVVACVFRVCRVRRASFMYELVRDDFTSLVPNRLEQVHHINNFNVNAIYNLFRPKGRTHPWIRPVSEGMALPKQWFIALLVALNQLLTIDNYQYKGFMYVNRCALCENSGESTEHLFFSCSWSSQLWTALKSWLSQPAIPCNLGDVLHWSITHIRGRALRKRVIRSALIVAIYYTWQERILRIFGGKTRTPMEAAKEIQYIIFVRKGHLNYM